MKKCLLIILCCLILNGCAAEETFETVADEQAQPVMAPVREMTMELPSEAASPTVESDSGRIYLCDGYEISVQTFASGDLNQTIQTISGYTRQELTVMHRELDALDRYDFVWASAGETGDRVGRAAILDDGSYHYVLMVLGDAEIAHAKLPDWSYMFGSFRLA